MELINVLNLMAEGKIKEGTKLEFDGFEYEFSEDHFEDDSGNWLEDVHEISASFLNLEVELIPPKPKKYYLRLDKDDNCSYINKNVYFSYEVANKSEHNNYKTKFTQEEIDGSIFLKFIEQHGIKEEVVENETD
ncbi:DUF3271 domain-containing protein [Enterococcus cecorum]|uniref:DUF3271 domain-containing protein n=1 Tax=Enterococcus cecorum TaxID=44008 RepID=UPI00148B4C8B|nr:DUF3271 domain-containing protein [Enterococcus cecorum]